MLGDFNQLSRLILVPAGTVKLSISIKSDRST
jgi:hypothetical protein